MQDVRVDTALGEIRVRVAGSGDAILFWPSLLMTGDMWSAHARHFADRYRVVLVDPPGHGDSGRLDAVFTFEQCARVVVDILDALGVGRAHIVGNSWGGMIGGTFAATYPDRVGRAVLMNCTASKAGVRQKIRFAALLRVATRSNRIGPVVLPMVLRAFLGPTSMRHRPDVVAYVRDTVRFGDVASQAQAVRSVVPRRPDQHALLSRITTSVLVVAGSEDATFPTAETKAMADSVPGSAFVVIDGVGHLAALEDPALTCRVIDEFLTG